MIDIKILEDLKEKIKTMSHYESADGQDLVMVADVGQCIDELLKCNIYAGVKYGTNRNRS